MLLADEPVRGRAPGLFLSGDDLPLVRYDLLSCAKCPGPVAYFRCGFRHSLAPLTKDRDRENPATRRGLPRGGASIRPPSPSIAAGLKPGLLRPKAEAKPTRPRVMGGRPAALRSVVGPKQNKPPGPVSRAIGEREHGVFGHIVAAVARGPRGEEQSVMAMWRRAPVCVGVRGGAILSGVEACCCCRSCA